MGTWGILPPLAPKAQAVHLEKFQYGFRQSEVNPVIIEPGPAKDLQVLKGQDLLQSILAQVACLIP